MNIWGSILGILGWKVKVTVPYRPKCVICVAPHTSNWDFPLGYAAWHSLGRKASFLMKEAWFFFPLKYLLKAMGGIPVPKAKGSHLTDDIVRQFAAKPTLNLAVTPEGTRSARTDWRKGFLYIALEAKVPIQLGVIDYKYKTVEVTEEYSPSGDIDADMQRIKSYYADKAPLARYPHKFLT